MVDVADPSGGQALVDECERVFGRLDALVNNAGIGINVRTVDLTLEDWGA